MIWGSQNLHGDFQHESISLTLTLVKGQLYVDNFLKIHILLFLFIYTPPPRHSYLFILYCIFVGLYFHKHLNPCACIQTNVLPLYKHRHMCSMTFIK